jgi:hypothetical protein
LHNRVKGTIVGKRLERERPGSAPGDVDGLGERVGGDGISALDEQGCSHSRYGWDGGVHGCSSPLMTTIKWNRIGKGMRVGYRGVGSVVGELM